MMIFGVAARAATVIRRLLRRDNPGANGELEGVRLEIYGDCSGLRSFNVVLDIDVGEIWQEKQSRQARVSPPPLFEAHAPFLHA
jgi:hypothetical protein